MKFRWIYRNFILLGAMLCMAGAFAQSPVASFTHGATTGCAPLTVSFTNASTNASTYYWSFGDGNTSVNTNPVNVYSQPGVYTVKLYATSAAGITDSLVAVNLITVSSSPSANFYPVTTTSCLDGNSFAFTNTSINGATWLWDFGDGNTSTQQNPVHSYSAAGYYTVQLIATNNNGCSDIKIIPQCVQVYSKPSSAFTSNTTTACSPSQVFQFSNSATAYSYLWNFGDNTTSTAASPSHTYSNAGNYTVSLITSNVFGCSDTTVQNNYITIYPQQTPSFSANDSAGCPPFAVNFTDLSANASSWLWNFGDNTTSTQQNPSHTYQNTGNYTVTLTITSANGCTYTRVMNSFISVVSPPTAYFTATNNIGCSPLATQFNNLSTNATSYYWEFGDNYFSAQANPAHTYYGNVTYSPTLHAYNSAGCQSQYQASSLIQGFDPLTDFSASGTYSCAPFTVGFTSTAINAVSYSWDFGDGNYSNAANPTHTYTLPGTYTVSLTTTTAQGCTKTETKNNYITAINTAASYVTPPTVNACAPFTTTFSNSTPGAISWLWNFGDNTTSTQQSPVHTYTTPGFYTVSLLIQTSGGCSQYYSQFRTYNIEQITPGFVFTSTPCSPFTVSFNDTTANATSWLWNFGDGFTSTQQNPIHAYPGAGLYSISLTATTGNGCSSTVIQSGAVDYTTCGNATGGGSQGSSGSGNSILPSLTGCVPLALSFKSPLAGTTSWDWDFGDGFTSTQQNPSHTYMTPGVYTVTVIGHYPTGGADTTVYTNYIGANGITAGFSILPPVNCQANVIAVNDTSQNAATWNWDFGDGFTSTSQNPVHTYSTGTNNFNITLTATSPEGCTGSFGQTMFNASGNVIWASTYDICYNSAVTFYCGSTFSSYSWDFGDNSYSSQQNPVHTYTTGGSFTVTLSVTDANGCPHTYTLASPVVVHQPLPDFTSTLTGSCNALAIQFSQTTTGAGQPLNSHLRWHYGDNTMQWSANPTHTYSAPGVYNVTLEAFYTQTCISTITKPVAVYPTQANFSYAQSSTCFPVSAAYTDSSTNAVSWLWDFGDGNTSTLQNPTHVFNAMPSAPVTLTITDIRGCTSTTTKPNIQIFNTAFAASVTSGCGPLAVSFSDSSLNASTWHWDFGDGNTSTLQNPAHVYTNSGSYTVTLISQTSAGCQDTMIFGPINVYKPQSNFMSPTAANCAPSLVSFTDQSSGASTWLWNFGDGSYSTSSSPSHIYNQPGVYTITLITGSSMGCYDTLIRPNYIHVLGPVAGFTASAMQACANSTIQFTDSSTAAFSWDWNFGDGNTSTQQNPSHLYTYAGQFNVSLIVHDTLGCSANYTLPAAIQVNPLPAASFAISDSAACAPAAISFTDQSQGGTSWAWDFGDGNNSSMQSPSHIYSTAGSYVISLVTTTASGCSDTAVFRSLVVNPTPLANFTAAVTKGCSPLQVAFMDSSVSSTPLTYQWTLGNNSTSALQNPQSTYYNPGYYTVSMIATNTFGCSDTVTKPSLLNVFDTLAPAASPILTATVISDTSTYIIWTPSTAADFAFYAIYRLDANTGMYQQVGTVSSLSASSFTDNGLNTLHNSYCYKVQTIDNCGYAIPLDSLIAHCTMNVTASAQGTGINVNWTSYSGATVGSYQVFRMEPGNSTAVLVATVPSSLHAITDTTLTCPVPYSYRIKALMLNNIAISSSSDTSMAAPALNPLAGQKTDVVRSTVIDNSSILTEWKAPTVKPQTVTGYNIYRSEDNDQFTLLASLPAAAFAYIDNNVDVNAKNYFYKIEVLNSCGVQAQPGDAGSSILLRANATDASTVLTWTPYEGWDMGVDYYIIEKQNGDGQWEVIKTVSGSTTQYEDK